MKKINLFLLIFLIILIIATGAVFLFLNKNLLQPVIQSNAINIQDKQIIDNAKPFKINIAYPEITGLNDFNQKTKIIIDKEIIDFKNNSLANDQAIKKVDPEGYAKYPREYDLNIGYDKGETDNNIISIVFDIYKFEGGAHGTSYSKVLVYSPKDKKELLLADIFANQPDYLKKISDYCITDLTKQIVAQAGEGNEQYVDKNWIKEGAGPNADNFKTFLVNKDSIVFYFDQYQVAPGASGQFKVIYKK